MQQGPVPTQLCCGTSKLGGARPTRMKESHEVYEIRQGTSDERPLCWRRPQRYVLRPELYGRLFVCDGDGDCPVVRQRHHQRLQDRPQYRPTHHGEWVADLLRRRQPGRAVLIAGSRFLYVLNRGENAQGGSVCTTANPCQNSNITQFAVGGNGILTAQQTFYTQGINPIRILTDATGGYLFVLDHDSPSNAACALALGASANTCGDITVFSINSSTGRLQLVVNAQVTAANGTALTYFPVPANPIDFLLTSGYIFTLSGTPTTGDSVFPYNEGMATGQLTVSQNSSQPLNIAQATAIVGGGSYIYVLDNEPIMANGTTSAQPDSSLLGWDRRRSAGSDRRDRPRRSNALQPHLPAWSNPRASSYT